MNNWIDFTDNANEHLHTWRPKVLSREELLDQIAELNKQLEELPERPAEPGKHLIDGVAPTTPLVVRFGIDFGRGKGIYHFAAIRTRGKWYTTGHVGPQGVSWKRLWSWIEERGGLIEGTSMQLVDRWKSL